MRIYEHLHEPVEQVLDAATAITPGRPRPLNCDSFVARSIMQKAIRRGDAPLALRAAATLTLTDSAVVWRRLLVIALEDLGVHELPALLRLAAAIERRRFGHRNAEEWPIIAAVIAEFCSGTCCQAANDLHNLAVNDSRHDAFRLEAGRMASAELLRFAGGDENDLIQRNIAILTLLGEGHAPWAKSGTATEARSVIEAAGGRLCPLIQSLYEWAFKKSGLSLATASLLLAGQGARGVPTSWTRDPLPPPSLIGEVPAFALDQYTRLGRAAIGDFVNASALWRSYVGGLGLSRQVERLAAGEMLFRVEGAVLTKRATWALARELHNRSSLVGCFVEEAAVRSGLRVIFDDLPLLHRFRADRLADAKCN